jgi:hypothetical protein
MNRDPRDSVSLKYVFSIIEKCRCPCKSALEQKNPNHEHSRCQIIKRQLNRDQSRDFTGFREFRYYRDDLLVYKLLKVHCDVCPRYKNPYFPDQYDEEIYYSVGVDEYNDVIQMN